MKYLFADDFAFPTNSKRYLLVRRMQCSFDKGIWPAIHSGAADISVKRNIQTLMCSGLRYVVAIVIFRTIILVIEESNVATAMSVAQLLCISCAPAYGADVSLTMPVIIFFSFYRCA